MITKYGISQLPSGNMAYRDGYRFGAYTISENEDMHITEFFKTREEIQKFVNEHPEYGKRGK